mmetsp:Transcript_93111/g.263167  ORF Transcript_93111/g.263167 Transcript_93111/m.263167 type:complete len:240 (-) Transcript_93111:155-874(-)
MYCRRGSECFSSRACSSRLICSRRSSCSFVLFRSSASARAFSSVLGGGSSHASSSTGPAVSTCAGGRKLMTSRRCSTSPATFRISSSNVTSLASMLTTAHSNFSRNISSNAGASSGFSFFHLSIFSWNSLSTTGRSPAWRCRRQASSLRASRTTASGAIEARGTLSGSGVAGTGGGSAPFADAFGAGTGAGAGAGGSGGGDSAVEPSSGSSGSGGGASSRRNWLHSSRVWGYPHSTKPR